MGKWIFDDGHSYQQWARWFGKETVKGKFLKYTKGSGVYVCHYEILRMKYQDIILYFFCKSHKSKLCDI